MLLKFKCQFLYNIHVYVSFFLSFSFYIFHNNSSEPGPTLTDEMIRAEFFIPEETDEPSCTRYAYTCKNFILDVH